MQDARLICARSEAGEAAEGGGEVLGTGEAQVVGDGGDGGAGLAEAGAGGLDLGAQDEFAGRQADFAAEADFEAGFGEADLPGQLGDVKWCGWVGGDVVEAALDARGDARGGFLARGVQGGKQVA